MLPNYHSSFLQGGHMLFYCCFSNYQNYYISSLSCFQWAWVLWGARAVPMLDYYIDPYFPYISSFAFGMFKQPHETNVPMPLPWSPCLPSRPMSFLFCLFSPKQQLSGKFLVCRSVFGSSTGSKSQQTIYISSIDY